MNTIFIIPTGIGCTIGGHAGDATPAARLIGSVSDHIILHPNVVNASDINEMPSNSLYVDGYQLDEFVAGAVGLCPHVGNKILVAVNEAIPNVVNAVNAARATLGVDAEIIELRTDIKMRATIQNGVATGTSSGIEELVRQVQGYEFDCLAVSSVIDCDKEVAMNYLEHGGTNPWGKIEAIVSREISSSLVNKLVAHAPIESRTLKNVSIVCDPRMSAELVSVAYLFCALKGLANAPRITSLKDANLSISDVGMLISPFMPLGLVHFDALKRGVEVVMVRNNTTALGECDRPELVTIVSTYLEAAGLIMCRSTGISPLSITRPIPDVVIHKDVHCTVKN